jgi:phage-related protein
MSNPEKKIPAFFYREPNGAEPVRDWLRMLGREDRQLVGEAIKTVEYGWPVGMPVCRPLGKGLYEVRSTITGRRIVRILFCIRNGRMVLLHGFIKKTRQTPLSEIEIAKKRQREVEQRS